MHGKRVDFKKADRGSDEDDEETRYHQYMQSRKIAPPNFDIDDEIDTEILTNEEVYKDLKELEDLLDKNEDSYGAAAKAIGRVKKKQRKLF